MTDAEFRQRVFEAMTTPVSDAEVRDFDVQCAADCSRVHADRVWTIIQEAEDE